MMSTKTAVGYFNFGTRCNERLLTSIFSLRRFWRGIVRVYNVGEPEPLMKHLLAELGVSITVIPDRKCNVLVARSSVWRHQVERLTLMLDSDTAVMHRVDEAFELLDRHGYLASHFNNWGLDGRLMRKRLDDWNKVDPGLVELAAAYGFAVNGGVQGWHGDNKAPLLAYEDLTIRGFRSGCSKVVLDEIAIQLLLPHHRHYLLPPRWNTSGPLARHQRDLQDAVIIHYHGDKHAKPGVGADLWARLNRLMLAALPAARELKQKPVKPAGPGSNTVVIATDAAYMPRLRKSAATWFEHGLLEGHPVHVITDGSVSKSELQKVLGLRVETSVFDRPAPTQRAKMLTSLIVHAPVVVETEFWTKLDADCWVDSPEPRLFQNPAWRKYDIVSHRWGYTKPAEMLLQLEAWRQAGNIGKPVLSELPRYGDRVFSHRRFQSFVCLHNTAASREMAALCRGYPPVASHDTYFWFTAMALGKRIKYVNLRKWGFKHGR